MNGFYVGPSSINSLPESTAQLQSYSDQSVDHVCAPQSIQSVEHPSLSAASLQSQSETCLHEAMDVDGHSADDISLRAARDGYVALGTIKLIRRVMRDEEPITTELFMVGIDCESKYPGTVLASALKKGWVRVEEVNSPDAVALSAVRIYVLPEDVDRGNRGSLRDFQKSVKFLLGFVDCSAEAWCSRSIDSTRPHTYRDLACRQEESLFYIFNTLQSPTPSLETTNASGYAYHVISDILNDSIAGLKTQLYPYQRRSIATMAQREADPVKICDARKRRFEDRNGRAFYLDPLEGVLLKDPPLYTEPQGGILAETMGYGKTLICISLMLATRGHYPRVPEGRVDSFEYEPRERVGSLLAMAARRTKHEGLPWKTEFRPAGADTFQFEGILKELDKYERCYAEPIFTPTTPGRKGKRESYNVVRLCSATLVIVPTNLVLQWQQEIAKHVEDGMLDVLIIDTPTTAVPLSHELLKYDVVLMSKARFEQEYRDDDLNQGKSRKGEARYRSPLTDIRWLRVICDEGHGFAGSSCRTNAMAMLDKMYIERRWVVSGTPSSTLHGVEIDLSTTVSSSTEINDNQSLINPDEQGRQQSISKALHKRKMPSTLEQEAKDLERLRLIVVNFLRLQPWANHRGSDNANWKKYLAPRISTDGKRLSSPSLREVLQTLIIRHRIEDIDCDLRLPALHTKIVYLDPSYHDKLAINMFALVLASNFVTSEREDEDYMFHPKNRRKFDLLINNLRQATFHWVGFTEDHVRDTIRISNEYMDKNVDKISDMDGFLLTEAILNGERALADPAWRAFSKLHELGVYVDNFPSHARNAWALDGRDHNPMLLGTVQAREARKYALEKTSQTFDDAASGLAGAGVRAMKLAHERAETELRQSLKSSQLTAETETIGAIDEPKLKAPPMSFAMSGVSKHKSTSSRNAGESLKRSYAHSESESLSQHWLQHTPNTSGTEVPQATLVGFNSAKLSYLVNQLLIHTPDSKSIIFYSHPNTAFFIAEALELLQIKHRIYASTLSMAQRNAYLQLFNSDDSIRVLLMDVKQAGQGLHIASANRVYIIAPIWEDGMQSQAIKRAHRIGQTKDVYVETLVLKGTFEEDLIRRRQEIDQNLGVTIQPKLQTEKDYLDQENPSLDLEQKLPCVTQKNKSQSLLDDRHMVQVLKNIKFLKFTHEEEHDINARIAWMHGDSQLRMLFRKSDIGSRLVETRSSSGVDKIGGPGGLTHMFKQSKSVRSAGVEGVSKRSKVTFVG